MFLCTVYYARKFFTDFVPYQRFYYCIYQSFDVNSTMCIQRVMQQYDISPKFQERIHSIKSNRLCNQSLLNYLLIELRKDKESHKFLQVLNVLITESTLMRAVENIHKGLCKS